jgi:hypothetical protein
MMETTYTAILDTITEQGNSVRILASSAAPMEFLVRINGNIRPVRDAIYQMNRSREYEERVAKFGRSLGA